MSKITFYHSLRPLLILCSSLGIISFNINDGKYNRSNLRIVTNLLMMVFYVIFTGHSLYERSDLDTTLLSMTTDIMQVTTSTLQIVVSWFMSAVSQEKTMSFLKRISDVDKTFRQLGVYIYYDAVHKSVIQRLLIRMSLVLASTISQLFLYQYQWNVGMISFYVTYYFPILINVLIVEEFYIYTNLLRTRYEILNQHLIEVQKYNDSCKEKISYIKLTGVIGSKLSTLRIICPIHHELTKIAKLLNEAFGVILLMSFQSSFVTIIVSLYDCSVLLQYFNIEHIRELCAAIIMCCTYVLDCLYICYSCHSTVESANKSGRLLHQIDTDDVDVKDQIEMFSLQIVNEKLEFTAAGFFTINYGLLFSVIV
ncbi:invertebrate gustatory receptor [Holotrichia oblita]|uniref:Invertebrate gustatory receptor n=1 Tax=Holotrichia oblita TaxID=644536 RepID=A0ACB9TII9_HOLOL|nr:invertebrate gustatory receptor [Holotrichia oblita]